MRQNEVSLIRVSDYSGIKEDREAKKGFQTPFTIWGAGNHTYKEFLNVDKEEYFGGII